MPLTVLIDAATPRVAWVHTLIQRRELDPDCAQVAVTPLEFLHAACLRRIDCGKEQQSFRGACHMRGNGIVWDVPACRLSLQSEDHRDVRLARGFQMPFAYIAPRIWNHT